MDLNSENLEIQDLVWAPGEHPTIDSSYMPAKDGNHQAQTHGGKHRHGRSEHHDNNDPAFLTPWEPAGLVSALFSQGSGGYDTSFTNDMKQASPHGRPAIGAARHEERIQWRREGRKGQVKLPQQGRGRTRKKPRPMTFCRTIKGLGRKSTWKKPSRTYGNNHY